MCPIVKLLDSLQLVPAGSSLSRDRGVAREVATAPRPGPHGDDALSKNKKLVRPGQFYHDIVCVAEVERSRAAQIQFCRSASPQGGQGTKEVSTPTSRHATSDSVQAL